MRTDRPAATGLGDGEVHAIVIGGGIGGLACAAALAEHAGQVTLVERDRYPERPQPRKGVPQGKHTHQLLEGGIRAFEELFPGWRHSADG